MKGITVEFCYTSISTYITNIFILSQASRLPIVVGCRHPALIVENDGVRKSMTARTT
jgi:hypothetical protein